MVSHKADSSSLLSSLDLAFNSRDYLVVIRVMQIIDYVSRGGQIFSVNGRVIDCILIFCEEENLRVVSTNPFRLDFFYALEVRVVRETRRI